MAQGMEWHLAEGPAIACLESMGYCFVPPADHAALRDGENQVLFRPHLIAAIRRINGVSEADARPPTLISSRCPDNEAWLSILRGNFSRIVQGEATRRTLRVDRFLRTRRTTSSPSPISSASRRRETRIADVVVHVNGIPLVVIECKSPINSKDKTGEAFEQIKQYERDIPRLFLSNCFNIVTDGTNCLYGATGSPSKFYAAWRDPWPRAGNRFPRRTLEGAVEPAGAVPPARPDRPFHRLREDRDGTVKKMCRYQQFRAVNKIVERVTGNQHRRGLIWHTQGSGKSLTMVFAALKLKTHLTVASPELANPNIMVLTDRIDLHGQISGTFAACGLPNPVAVESIRDLRTSSARARTA